MFANLTPVIRFTIPGITEKESKTYVISYLDLQVKENRDGQATYVPCRAHVGWYVFVKKGTTVPRWLIHIVVIGQDKIHGPSGIFTVCFDFDIPKETFHALNQFLSTTENEKDQKELLHKLAQLYAIHQAHVLWVKSLRYRQLEIKIPYLPPEPEFEKSIFWYWIRTLIKKLRKVESKPDDIYIHSLMQLAEQSQQEKTNKSQIVEQVIRICLRKFPRVPIEIQALQELFFGQACDEIIRTICE